MGIRGYFRGAELARMSNGDYCIVRPLGLVKGGKGMKHFLMLLRLTPRGIASKLVEIVRTVAERPDDNRFGEKSLAGVPIAFKRDRVSPRPAEGRAES